MASPYHRIQSAAGDIRILIVQPGQPEDPLECHLEVARLSLDQGSKPENSPSYEAISYCWGDPTPCKPCDLDGIAIKIPASASEVIHRFRLSDAPRRIWIDALCINQQDIVERGEQVSLMGAVYSQCTRCLVWLGPDTDNTARTAFDTVGKVCHAAREADRESKDPMVEMLSMLSSRSFTRSVFNASFEQRLRGERGEPSFKLKDIQDDLFTLLRRPWFQRKWVFQEVVLAPESIVYYGTETRLLSTILEAGHSLYRHRAWSHTPEEILMVRDLHLLWSYFSPETNDELPVDSRTLLALLAFLRTKSSTDPKDAVFSVLGLVKRNVQTNDSFQALLKVDYKRPVGDILASATKYAIVETQTLDVLRFVLPRLNENVDTSQIPSWVPRWHLRLEDIDMSANRVDPSGEFDATTKLELIDPHDDSVLKCRGDIIDDICYRFDAPSKDVVKDASALAAFFKNLRSLFRRDILSQAFESATIDDTQARRIRNARLPNMYSADEESSVISSTLMMGRQYPMQQYIGKETDDLILLESYLDEPGLVLPALPEDGVIPTTTFKDRSLGEQAFVRFAMIMRLVLHHRAFFTTSRGLIGLGPSTMEVCDVVAMLHGFPFPVVLRPKGDGYEFLESCYVHGLMRGRNEWPAGVVAKEEIISIR
ncbi:HET domain-containing protein [Fusarium sp. LHS14.1]|nr:HET domain-containing protein [Fusarium sp. LHS14.1]